MVQEQQGELGSAGVRDIERYAPDTNFFIQFRRPEELGWSDLTDAITVELTVLDEVVHELDNHKNSNNERRSRRSRDTLQILRPLILGDKEVIVVRENNPTVMYRLAPNLPMDRAKPATLDTSKPDGRIVEEALAVQSMIGKITLLTHDGLPMLMARKHGLSVAPLPDKWRLGIESDAKDKEIARLSADLKIYQKRAPVVSVDLCVNSVPVKRIEGSLPRYLPISSDFCRRAMASVIRRYPREMAGIAGGRRVYRADDLAKYERERDTWESDLRSRLERYSLLLNAEHSLFTLDIVLNNSGSMSAEDFVVEVLAEGNVILVNRPAMEKFFQEPRMALTEPPRMRTPMDVFGLTERMEIPFSHYTPGSDYLLQDFPGPPGRDFYWTFEDAGTVGRKLEGTCGDFRHQMHQEVRSLTLSVPHDSTEKPEGCIRVRFSAKNLIERVEQVWPVSLTCTSEDTETAVEAILRSQLSVAL